MQRCSFEDVVAALGLESQRQAWQCWWLPFNPPGSDADLWLAAPGRLEECVGWLSLDPQAQNALASGLASVMDDTPARTLLAQCSRLMAAAHAPPPSLPRLPSRLGAWTDVFAALVVLGCIPVTRRRHEARGIAEAVTRATFNDLGRWMRAFRETQGRWGFAQADWLFNHVSGRLVELGRLQFGRGPSDFPYHAFAEEGGGGRATLLAADGCRIRPDGQFVNADHGAERDGPQFVTRFELGDDKVIGHPVDELGRIEAQPITLAFPRWRCVAQPGDPVLDVHIPAFAPLDDTACADSFRQALEFFPRHFPEHRFTGFTCGSWLMDPQLAQYLPAESNIVRFQRRFVLAPAPGAHDFQHFERVFGGPVKDPASAPRDSTLRRALLEHVERGGRWRYGYGVALRRALEVAVH